MYLLEQFKRKTAPKVPLVQAPLLVGVFWGAGSVLPFQVQNIQAVALCQLWKRFLQWSFLLNSKMSEALWRGWKATLISVILTPTLIDAFSFIFCQFLRRNPVHWKHKCNEGRTLPGSARNTEGTVFTTRHLGRDDQMCLPLCTLILSGFSLITGMPDL